MKQSKPLTTALAGAIVALIAGPVFASSSLPPTETATSPAPVATNTMLTELIMPNTVANYIPGAKDATRLTATNSTDPTSEAGIDKFKALNGDDMTAISSTATIPTAAIKAHVANARNTAEVLLPAAPPPNGFAIADLLGRGGNNLGMSSMAAMTTGSA